MFGNILRLTRTLSDFDWLMLGNRSQTITDNFKTEPRHEKTTVLHKLCENKDADQLRGDCEADQRLCFCYIDTIPLLS